VSRKPHEVATVRLSSRPTSRPRLVGYRRLAGLPTAEPRRSPTCAPGSGPTSTRLPELVNQSILRRDSRADNGGPPPDPPGRPAWPAREERKVVSVLSATWSASPAAPSGWTRPDPTRACRPGRRPHRRHHRGRAWLRRSAPRRRAGACSAGPRPVAAGRMKEACTTASLAPATRGRLLPRGWSQRLPPGGGGATRRHCVAGAYRCYCRVRSDRGISERRPTRRTSTSAS